MHINRKYRKLHTNIHVFITDLAHLSDFHMNYQGITPVLTLLNTDTTLVQCPFSCNNTYNLMILLQTVNYYAFIISNLFSLEVLKCFH